MILGGFFQPVKSMSPDEVRSVIRQKNIDAYCLLDVRQPGEYEQGHIPGARLVPLGELQAHLQDIAAQRLTIVYCRSGNRSRSAVGILNGAGFEDVYNMEGGMLAYNGLVALGPPEAGAFCFPKSLTPEQLVAMAWYIEAGSRRYYTQLQQYPQLQNAGTLIAALTEYKTAHKNALVGLYEKISGQKAGADFPETVLPLPPADVMAGCVNVPDALGWSKGRGSSDILELMMSLEANTLDLYLKLARQVESEQARTVFSALSEEQTRHLNVLANAFEKTL